MVAADPLPRRSRRALAAVLLAVNFQAAGAQSADGLAPLLDGTLGEAVIGIQSETRAGEFRRIDIEVLETAR